MKDIILYHGSYCEVKQPDLKHTTRAMDFGRGFYLTSNLQQACSFSNKYGNEACVNVYIFNNNNSLNIKEFETYGEEWLDFVVSCRQDLYTGNFDIVKGNVADDKVYDVIYQYTKKRITRKQALFELVYRKANNQYCFLTENALECLVFNECLYKNKDY